MTKFGWLMVLIGCAHTPVPQVASWDLVGGRGIVTVPVDDGREEPEAGMLHAGLTCASL